MSYWYQQLADKLFKQDVFGEAAEVESGTELSFGHFITVSRDPGSGGRPVAELVAKKLGFTLYDKKLIGEIAKTSNTREAVMKDIDEKSRSLIDDLVHNLLNPDYVPEDRYFKYLCKVLLSIAQKGKAVIVGRGSNFIIPKAYGLHVRITAPYRVSVARAVQYEKIPYQRAREKVGEVMEDRSAFVRRYFGKDIINPKYYDMTINTTFFSIEQAADLVVQAFKMKFPQA